jgi:hypothetical protein
VKADTTIRYPEMFKPCSDYDSEEDEWKIATEKRTNY